MRKQATSSEFPWQKALTLAGASLGLYTLAQAATDTEYSTRTLPKSVRDDLKDESIDRHGLVCPKCGVEVSADDLVIDHIQPFSKGGRTSINNSQVLCKWCNSEKSDHMTLLDWFLGRGGRQD